jgi:hypothetical protein
MRQGPQAADDELKGQHNEDSEHHPTSGRHDEHVTAANTGLGPARCSGKRRSTSPTTEPTSRGRNLDASARLALPLTIRRFTDGPDAIGALWLVMSGLVGQVVCEPIPGQFGGDPQCS